MRMGTRSQQRSVVWARHDRACVVARNVSGLGDFPPEANDYCEALRGARR